LKETKQNINLSLKPCYPKKEGVCKVKMGRPGGGGEERWEK
jgi:hypothetical protein